jgi:hypothetical protein
MTKLVTGIEAIQSGKPFRWNNPESGVINRWIDPRDKEEMINVRLHELLACKWEIKQEPREFWIEVNSVGTPIVADTEEFNPSHSGTKVIKVREVINGE